MDLIVERLLPDMPLPNNDSPVMVFSLAHYFKQNGDLCSDPQMVIAVYPELKEVEALTFEQSLPPIYQVVYPEPGKFYPRQKQS